MKETLAILCVLFIIVVAVVCVLVAKVDLLERKAEAHADDIGGLRGRAEALERRTDWLARDADDGFARQTVNLQRCGSRLMKAITRLKAVETYLGLDPRDAFKKDGEQER